MLRPWERSLSRPLLAAIAFAASLTLACAPPRQLTNTLESDEALARAVLDAIGDRDADRLAALALTKHEFEEIVWPTLPVSRPEVGMPMDYLWQDTATKSRSYLAQTLADYGGQRFTLVRVEFRGETTAHDGYGVSRKTHLVVKDEAGHERTLRLFGSIIRQAGRSKVYSYILD
jgi:hypothetical protein